MSTRSLEKEGTTVLTTVLSIKLLFFFAFFVTYPKQRKGVTVTTTFQSTTSRNRRRTSGTKQLVFPRRDVTHETWPCRPRDFPWWRASARGLGTRHMAAASRYPACRNQMPPNLAQRRGRPCRSLATLEQLGGKNVGYVDR